MTGFAMPGMTGVDSAKVPEVRGSGLLGSSGVAHMGIGGVMGGIGATFGSMGNAFMRPHPYDCLTPLGPLTDYKGGGSSVKFESFNGESDKKKALSFIQQFDNAFSGGNFTEASKIRKAASLKVMCSNGGLPFFFKEQHLLHGWLSSSYSPTFG